MEERDDWKSRRELSNQIQTILFDARSFLAVDPCNPFNNSYDARGISLVSLKRVVDGVSKLPKDFLDSHPEFPWERMVEKWGRTVNGGPGFCDSIVHYDVASDLYRLIRILKTAL